MSEVPPGVLLVWDRLPPLAQSEFPGHRGTASAYAAIDFLGLLPQSDAPMTPGRRHPFSDVVRGLLRYPGRCAVDLRLRVEPGPGSAVQVALLLRTWATTAKAAAHQVLRLREELLHDLPAELETRAVCETERVSRLLDPYGDQPVQAAVVTKREWVRSATRQDSARPFHLAVSTFGSRPEDWAPLYRALSRSTLPLTVSLGLFPVQVPQEWYRELASRVQHDERLGEGLQVPGGLYYGPHRLEPDRFAAFAARGLRDALASWSSGTAVARLQLTAPQLPVDAVELLGSVLTSSPLVRRTEPGYEVRWLRGAQLNGAARWNLATLDCYPAPGRAEIWNRPGWLTARDALLSVVVDAEEAAAVLGLPTSGAGGAALLPVRGDRAGTGATRGADVVVLTTTPIEAAALEEALDAVGARRLRVAFGATNTYTIHHSVSDTVVAHVRCTMGTAATGGSALTVAAAVDDLKPWAVIAVGIAFGADVLEQPLNDVLLSERLVAYESQRWGTDDAGRPVIRDRGPSVPASPTLLGRFRDSHLEDLGIRVQAGPLLSGEKLVDNADFKAGLLRRFPDAIGGEMEGAGLFAASHRAAVEWLVVKAVCDHGQDKATDKRARQREAAAVAAQAFAAVLRGGGLRSVR